MKPIPLGAKGSFTVVVQPEHLANRFKDAMLPPLRAQGFGGVTLAINVERAEDVQPGLDMAKAAGATILKPATKAEWGGVSGYFADPDGYPWEVVWAPRSRFKPDGSPDPSSPLSFLLIYLLLYQLNTMLLCFL